MSLPWKFPIRLLAICSLFAACSANPTSNSPLICQKIWGLDPILKAGQVLLIGEIHGTQEAPAYMETVVCNALEKKLAVTVGLELPRADQAALETYLQSAGTEVDQQRFLQLPFWAKEYQDGRASQAMFALIESIRSLQQDSKKVELIFIDEPSAGDRDMAMAEKVIEKSKETPTHFFVVLTGNYHNMIHEDARQMGSYVLEALGKERVLSVNQNYRGGSAWVATSNGAPGPYRVGGDGMQGVGIVLDSNLFEYDGTFEMDSVHHSRPAKEKWNQVEKDVTAKIFQPNLISTQAVEYALTFSPSQTELYFVRSDGQWGKGNGKKCDLCL